MPSFRRNATPFAQFDEGVEELKEAVDDGPYDNEGLVGLEYEFYIIRGQGPTTTGGTNRSRQAGTLARHPNRTLSFTDFERELGLHKAEMRTMPQPHDGYGLAVQGDEVRTRLAMVRCAILPLDVRLVSDGLWTIPPIGDTAEGYLTDAVEVDGITLATNMRESARMSHRFATGCGGTELRHCGSWTWHASTSKPGRVSRPPSSLSGATVGGAPRGIVHHVAERIGVTST